MSGYRKTRNRPDKDGKDRTAFMRYRNRILSEFSEEGFVNCSICGLPINLSKSYPNPWSLTIDHIIPIVKGGTTRDDNLQPAHFRCNRKKAEKLAITLSEINELREEQGAPRINEIRNLGYVRELPIKEQQGQAAQSDLDKARRGFPQSYNWRVY